MQCINYGWRLFFHSFSSFYIVQFWQCKKKTNQKITTHVLVCLCCPVVAAMEKQIHILSSSWSGWSVLRSEDFLRVIARSWYVPFISISVQGLLYCQMHASYVKMNYQHVQNPLFPPYLMLILLQKGPASGRVYLVPAHHNYIMCSKLNRLPWWPVIESV